MVLASLLLLAPAAWAASLPLGILQGPKLENLVTFGDSYTDEGRYTYMVQNKRLPPVDSMLPASNTTWSGGYSWGRYVANRTGATYYDYAVAGGMCADTLVPRWLNEIQAPFPSVLNYEMTAFEEGLKYTSLYPNRRDDNTVYALWIGTNDLGIDGFLGDREDGDRHPDGAVCVAALGRLGMREPLEAQDEENGSADVGGIEEGVAHRWNILSMRCVTRKPPAMLIVARTTAASPTREAAELPFTCSMPPMTMMPLMALVTLMSGVCSAGVTLQTT